MTEETSRALDASSSPMARLLDRALTPGDLRQQTEHLARPDATVHERGESILVFVIGADHLAVPAQSVARVTRVVNVHRIPHRSNAIVCGLGNIEGELVLCASLSELLGLGGAGEAAAEADDRPDARVVVLGAPETRWAFPVDRVDGVVHVEPGALRTPPLTVERAIGNFTRSTLRTDGRDVALLDAERVLGGFGEGAGMSGLGDFSMFELFKAEAETSCGVLNAGLLAIESNPDDLGQVEPLMRAAHSIKGAARIIGLDVIVTLAHAMEDCLVAVQKGEEVLTAGRIDQLLRGTDMLEQIGLLVEDQVPGWSEEQGGAIDELTSALRSPPPAAAETAAPPVDEAPAEPPEEALAESADKPPVEPVAPAASAKAEPAGDDVAVRVNAGSLNRMMQLASESMIASRRFQKLHQDLAQLREVQRQLSTVIERVSAGDTGARRAVSDAGEIRRLGAEARRLVHDHAVELDQTAWRSERLSTELYDEVLGSRMRPLAEGVKAFPRTVRDLARSLGKKIQLEIVGETVPVDRDILRKLEAPLNHILRNCVDHGIEPPDERRAAGKPEQGRIVLEARHHAGMLTVEVRDDGRGIDPERIRAKVIERNLADDALAADLTPAELMDFLFLPGFSTVRGVTEVSGRGVGLDVVQSMVHEVAGAVRAESVPGRSTTFTFRLPVTLSVVRAAVADVAGEPYAFPLSRLVRLVELAEDDITPVEGRLQFRLDDEPVGLVNAAEVLGLGDDAPTHDPVSVLVIGQPGQLCGLIVDRFIGEQDLVVRPLDPRLGRVAHVASAAVLEEGEPILIVDVEDVFHDVRQRLGEGRLRGVRSLAADARQSARPRVLVVDDSITVREVERQLLLRHGYDVDVAVDGRDGWNTLASGSYDLLVTDVDMPRMNGIELIRTVRRDPRFVDLPIIIVSYKGREEDRLLGLEVGANAYLTKGSFHDESLVQTVSDLIGGAT